ncbi:hypothetical protein BH24DEI2_BH24DEI2_25470 [soil metagenome]
MALLEHKARTLQEAMKNLDPVHSLNVDELDRYFVEREQTPVFEMATSLEDAYPQKFLFTGHRGNGKSTELAKLERYLSENFFIVRYALRNILDLYDISYVDVLLSMAIQMAEKVQAENVKLAKTTKDLLELRWSFGREIEQQVERGSTYASEASIGADGILSTIVNLKARISRESSTRKVMREKVTPDISNLFEGIDVLARDIKQKTGREVLCILEDLDKIDPEKAEQIFYKNAQSISDPNIAIIYTFPVALHHSNEYTQIKSFFENTYTLPNFRVENRNKIESILLQRIEENLMDTKALDLLVDYSGGVPRSLIRLARAACSKARAAAVTQINVDHVKDAINKERNEFDRMLTQAQREALKKVVATKTIDQTDEYRELLHNLSILEYENGSLWHDVNPVVKDLLK